jgi:uncharacterized membrane protein YeaQ/YmgE (transglycosylase-associated protein family)
MNSFLIYIIVGGLLGWVASIIMRTNAQQGILLNILVGIIGAFLAGVILTPLVGISTIGQGNYSLGAIVVSLLGSIILLAIVNALSRGRLR